MGTGVGAPRLAGLWLSLILLAACGDPVHGRTLLGRWALVANPACPAPTTAAVLYEFHADGTYAFQTQPAARPGAARYAITGPNRIRLASEDYVFRLNTEASTLLLTAPGAVCRTQYVRAGPPPVP